MHSCHLFYDTCLNKVVCLEKEISRQYKCKVKDWVYKICGKVGIRNADGKVDFAYIVSENSRTHTIMIFKRNGETFSQTYMESRYPCVCMSDDVVSGYKLVDIKPVCIKFNVKREP